VRGYREGMVITAAYRDFFEAIAAAAGSLTGLLFVALTVTQRRTLEKGPAVIQQVRAAAALLAFVNAPTISLFGLAPGTGVRWPAATFGVIGLMFAAAGTRSIMSNPTTARQRSSQLRLLNLLVLVFGTDLVTGIILILNSHNGTALDVLTDALVVSLLVGIARAWEFVGDWDTGFLASLSVLTNHQTGLLSQRADDGTGQSGDGAGESADGTSEPAAPEVGDPLR
jgi:hypothetical protein